MQRVTLLAAGAALLSAGIFLTRSGEDLPCGEMQLHHAGVPVGRALMASSAEGEVPGRKHRTAAASAEISRFLARAKQIASMQPDTERENAIRTLAQEWARESAHAAEEWAVGIEDAAERERALDQICLEVSARDPRGAIRVARENGLQGGISDAIASRWATTDFEAAAKWGRALPEGEERDRVLMRLVQSRATLAPENAASMLSEWGLTGTAGEEAAIAVLHQWLLKDPESARKWVELFPDGTLKQRASAAVEGISSR